MLFNKVKNKRSQSWNRERQIDCVNVDQLYPEMIDCVNFVHNMFVIMNIILSLNVHFISLKESHCLIVSMLFVEILVI